MNYFIGFTLVIAAFAAVSSSPVESSCETKRNIDLFDVNRAVAKCGPSTIFQTCYCGPNDLHWTPCMYCELGVDDIPVGHCVSLARVEKLCNDYAYPEDHHRNICSEGNNEVEY